MAKKAKHVWRGRALVLREIKRLEAEGVPDRECHRCAGEGFIEREDWIVTEADGRRACFSCKGEGFLKGRDRKFQNPFTVRYAVAARLVPMVWAGDLGKIMEEETRQRADVYWPILEDVFYRALAAAERIAGA